MTTEDLFSLGPFTFFDLETSGFSPVSDRIIEIAALKIEKNAEESRFHSLLNPHAPISKNALAKHGIDEDMLRGAPTFAEIAPAFLKFAEGTSLVAHNARFDLAFLQESLDRSGLQKWSGNTFDSIKLFKIFCPDLPCYGLESLAERFGISIPSGRAHRAMNDAETLAELFKLILRNSNKKP